MAPRADSFMAQQQFTAVGSLSVRGFLPDQISIIHFRSLTEFFCAIWFLQCYCPDRWIVLSYGSELQRSVFYYVKRQRFLWVLSTSTVILDKTKFSKHFSVIHGFHFKQQLQKIHVWLPQGPDFHWCLGNITPPTASTRIVTSTQLRETVKTLRRRTAYCLGLIEW